MVKAGKNADSRTALQWTKTVRDLVELRGTNLTNIKMHLLGRDETGAAKEPPGIYGHNDQIEFERYFKNQVSAWTQDDLKLQCEDCGIKSEAVSNRCFSHPYPKPDEYYDLCGKCFDKRVTKSNRESKDWGVGEPASKGEVRAMIRGAAQIIKILRTLPIDQRIAKLEELLANKPEVAPGMEPACDAYRGVLQKELDNAKRLM